MTGLDGIVKDCQSWTTGLACNRRKGAAATINVNLTPELEEFVQWKVRSGRCNSASEVVREALHLMELNDELRAVRLQSPRNRIDRGLAEAERGELADGEVFMERLLAGLPERGKKSKAG